MAGLKTAEEYREKAQTVRAQAARADHEGIKSRFLA
jgi:hypothetical protein